MRQLTCTGPGVISWVDVPEPEVQATTDVLVQPVTVARCEIDPFLILAGPVGGVGFALGHEAVTRVVAVGDDVTHVRPGDLAIPAFQVSCGTCGPCRAGRSAVCAAYPLLSDYGMQPLSGTEYGGMLSDLVRVPHAATMLTPLPAGVDPVTAASVADNVTDGYRGVAAHLAARPGADVLVVIHGTPSIGLYAAAAAVGLGAETVTVAGDDAEVLAAAEGLGAKPLETDFTGRDGRWPIVVDCGVRTQGLQYAVASTEAEGILQSVSSYVAEPMVPLPLVKLYTRGISFHIGRAHSASLVPEVVDRVAAGMVDPALVPTTVIGWDEAPDRYTDPAIKLVVRHPSLG